jgi:alanine dehydrogenase
VPRTSTKALTNVTLPYVELIASTGIREAARRDHALSRGVNVARGQVTHEAIAEAHGLAFAAVEDVLVA